MKEDVRICVLGGCGAMGRVVVDCLLRLDRKVRVTVADRRPPGKQLSARCSFKQVNLMDHSGLVKVLREHALVVNSTSHHFNLPVMRAALGACVHYLDLGGLFHFTRRQLKLDAAFRQKNLLAILGMGCAPGIANLLAKWAAEGMERVESIHIRVGGRMWGGDPTAIPYAIGTIREELCLKPSVYQRGGWRFVKPLSGMEQHPFPSPVGRQKIFFTLHSEVATLPRSFPGVRECSFKIGFSDEVIQAVLHPRSAKKVSASSPPATPLRDCEITMAHVEGWVKGKRIKRSAWCKAVSKGGRSAGDWDTAWPPAIVSKMILDGMISNRGVFPPEQVVPLESFLAHLKRAGFVLKRE